VSANKIFFQFKKVRVLIGVLSDTGITQVEFTLFTRSDDGLSFIQSSDTARLRSISKVNDTGRFKTLPQVYILKKIERRLSFHLSLPAREEMQLALYMLHQLA
jgi:hypothetical protein